MTQRSYKSTKIDWLIAHRDLWAHEFIDVLSGGGGWPDLKLKVCNLMKVAGLVSTTTSCNEIGIHKMLTIALERMKGGE
jgi:hypothetical protein